MFGYNQLSQELKQLTELNTKLNDQLYHLRTDFDEMKRQIASMNSTLYFYITQQDEKNKIKPPVKRGRPKKDKGAFDLQPVVRKIKKGSQV